MKPAPLRGALPTAKWILRSGMWPIAVHKGEKRPIGKSWGVERPSPDRLVATFEANPGAGVGIALGPVAGVVDFEIDDEATAPSVDLPPSLGWLSSRGSHTILRWDKRLEGLPATIHIGGAELRIGGEGKQTMSIAPPTVGTNRKRRRWQGPWQVAPFPEALLKAMEKPVHAGRAPLNPIVIPSGTSRYAEAAMRYEVEAVASAKEGTRNSLLNRAAFSLGTLVGAGALEREAVEADLIAAAVSVGLSEREAAATVKSGLDAGIKKPRR